MVNCKDQAEIDYYWDKLGEGGDESKRQCGWLADRFGLSWQIVPDEFHKMLNSPEIEKRDRAYLAMMHMEKLDVDGLRKAFEGE
jgi:predicted 3-demethylubiquinone-9 3-methyltransferase (glyoxalase superfamily)